MSQPPPSPGSRVLSRRGTTHFSVPKQELFDQQSSREEINAEREELKSVHFLGRAQGLMSGVLPLAAAFDKFDEDGSGGIDSQELRKALEYLGVDVGSNEKAQAILEAYDSYADNTIDAKEFTAIVRDMQMMLKYDANGDGVMDAGELVEALTSLGISCDADLATQLIKVFDVSGTCSLDIAELGPLMRTVQAFKRYDVDNSGTIDEEELREALRKLGLQAGQLEAAAIFRKYDDDANGTIDLAEFAVLVRDIQVFVSFDVDSSGALDATELYAALLKLGMAVTKDEAASLFRAWDADSSGTIDLAEFSQLVGDLHAFRALDAAKIGALDEASVLQALTVLGVKADKEAAAAVIFRHSTTRPNPSQPSLRIGFPCCVPRGEKKVASSARYVRMTDFAAIVRELTAQKPTPC